VKFEVPLPKDKVKTELEKTKERAGVPQVECAGCASAAARAAAVVSALTQGWRGEKDKLEEKMRLLQEQVASLRQQLAAAQVGDTAKAQLPLTTQGALSRTQKKVRAAAKKKQAEEKLKPVDLTRVVPDCVVEQMKLKPDFRQTVLTRYEPGDESTFPGAAYLHPKEADEEKRKHQEEQKGKASDANGKAKEKEMTAAERSEYEKIKRRAERYGIPLSVYWSSRR